MYVGLHLKAENNVQFLGRSKSWKQLLENAKSLTTSKLEQKETTTASNVSTFISYEDVEREAPPDMVIFTLKRLSIDSALEPFVTALKNSAKKRKIVVVTLMNGVGAADQIKRILDKHDTGFEFEYVEGMWSTNVVQQEAGGNINWHQGSSGDCYFSNNDGGKYLCECLSKTAITVKLSDEMSNVQYGKLLLNLNNAVNALSGIPLSQELMNGGYRQIFANCMLEALQVYNKAGIKPVAATALPPWLLANTLAIAPTMLLELVRPLIVKVDEHATSSSFEDLKNNRKTEIDYLQGEIIRLAKEHNVQAPTCQLVYDQIKKREAEGFGIIPLTPEQILNKQ
ncbi:hypothetical protein HK103_001088 [Boothiomyces macroporosus]|uniref:2-dehydropantoate 2-reductase n=1 Tax=Boothiomyces macroporosus TaxID=261099 RepID=A0AAD5UE60_9FUNG|nr:hypothetical protein HK103_001088 [Boothiomyces macroporosus]